MINTNTYGLTHIALVVRDLDRTLKFYRHVVGMEAMYPTNDFLQLTTPGCHDILVFQKDVNLPSVKGGGMIHFGFRLRDPTAIGEVIERINEAGEKSTIMANSYRDRLMSFFEDIDWIRG